MNTMGILMIGIWIGVIFGFIIIGLFKKESED